MQMVNGIVDYSSLQTVAYGAPTKWSWVECGSGKALLFHAAASVFHAQSWQRVTLGNHFHSLSHQKALYPDFQEEAATWHDSPPKVVQRMEGAA